MSVGNKHYSKMRNEKIFPRRIFHSKIIVFLVFTKLEDEKSNLSEKSEILNEIFVILQKLPSFAAATFSGSTSVLILHHPPKTG